MPMWKVYAPEGAYTKEQKQDFTNSITQVYVDCVRITVDHIARRMPDSKEFRKMAMQAFEDAIEPHVKDRGFRWEIHIDETPLELWRVNGIEPPPAESAAEKEWALQNYARHPCELA